MFIIFQHPLISADLPGAIMNVFDRNINFDSLFKFSQMYVSSQPTALGGGGGGGGGFRCGLVLLGLEFPVSHAQSVLISSCRSHSTQVHLKNVYSSLAVCMFVAGAGSYVHVVTRLFQVTRLRLILILTAGCVTGGSTYKNTSPCLIGHHLLHCSRVRADSHRTFLPSQALIHPAAHFCFIIWNKCKLLFWPQCRRPSVHAACARCQGGLLSVLGSLGMMFWLAMTPHNSETEKKRLAILAGFAFLTGKPDAVGGAVATVT